MDNSSDKQEEIIEIESNQRLVIDHLDSKIDLNVKLLSDKIDELIQYHK